MDGALERALVDKKPVPEIDFTLHTMEDGTQVSTQERICKGISPNLLSYIKPTDARSRSTGARHAPASK
jgi:serine/threonine-protein phosphatase 2B catalytic subunit